MFVGSCFSLLSGEKDYRIAHIYELVDWDRLTDSLRRHTQLYVAMSDLQSKHWIVAKGIAFWGIAVVAAVLVLFESPSVRTAVFLTLLVWAACRFYYFLFYVLERYVDPTLRYAGLIALVRAILKKGSRRLHNDV